MNASATQAPSTDVAVLPLTERIQLALRSIDTEARLTALAQKSTAITAITNADGYKECHTARMALKRERVDIERTGKTARDDARKFADGVIAEERRLIALIAPEEQRLQKLQDDHDAAIEKAEKARLATIHQRIGWIQQQPIEHVSKPSAEIAATIDAIDKLDMSVELYGEFLGIAQGARADTLERLRTLHAATVTKEDDAARLARERAAFDAEQAATRERNAREDAERKARIEREDAERKYAIDWDDAHREAQQRADDAERERARKIADDARAAEEAEAERVRLAEKARVALIHDRLNELAAVSVLFPPTDASALRALIADVELLPVSAELFAEWLPNAQAAKAESLRVLRNRLELMEDEAQQRAEREALERKADPMAALVVIAALAGNADAESALEVCRDIERRADEVIDARHALDNPTPITTAAEFGQAKRAPETLRP